MFLKKVVVTISSFLIIFLFVILCSSNSFAKTYKNYTYTVLDKNNKTAALTGVKNPKANLVIPSKINGYTIVQIGRRVYDKYDEADCKRRWLESDFVLSENDKKQVVTKIIIPKTVKVIGYNAFSGCEKLKILTLPEGLEIISCYAFNYCTVLKKVTLPKTLKSVGVGGFGLCYSIQKVEIKSIDIRIGEDAFLTSKNFSYTFHIKKSVRKIDINSMGMGIRSTKCKLVVPATVKEFCLGEQLLPLKLLTIKGKNTKLDGCYRIKTTSKNYFMATTVKAPKNSKAWKYFKRALCPTLKSCLESIKAGGDGPGGEMKKVVLKSL